jgi:transposase
MSELTAIGLDLAKNVFHVHGIDAEGKIKALRQLSRGDVLKFFKGLSRVWWDCRLAEQFTTGPGR